MMVLRLVGGGFCCTSSVGFAYLIQQIGLNQWVWHSASAVLMISGLYLFWRIHVENRYAQQRSYYVERLCESLELYGLTNVKESGNIVTDVTQTPILRH